MCDDGLHPIECADELCLLRLACIHFIKDAAYLIVIGSREPRDPFIAQCMLACAVSSRFFEGRYVAGKDLTNVVQQRHEEDAPKIGARKLIVHEVCHEGQPPAMFGDALLAS